MIEEADTLQLKGDRHIKSAWVNNITQARDQKKYQCDKIHNEIFDDVLYACICMSMIMLTNKHKGYTDLNHHN